MSDFEINRSVAVLEGYNCSVKQYFGEKNLSAVMTTEGSLDFCRKWEDSGPIIERERITLIAPNTGDYYKKWDSHGPDSDGYCQSDENPLRAAMITFLMMQEKK